MIITSCFAYLKRHELDFSDLVYMSPVKSAQHLSFFDKAKEVLSKYVYDSDYSKDWPFIDPCYSIVEELIVFGFKETKLLSCNDKCSLSLINKIDTLDLHRNLRVNEISYKEILFT